MRKRKSKLIYYLIYKLSSKPHVKVEKVPTPSKPCGQARRKLKNKGKMLDLAYVLPTHKLKEEGRSYHFPSYTLSSNNQAKKKKCTTKLENERRGLEIATKFPQGVLKCCVCLFGAAKSLQPDLIHL
jgi:hypothetical protein